MLFACVLGSLQAAPKKEVVLPSKTLIPLITFQNSPKIDFSAFQLEGAVPGKIWVMGPDAFSVLADTDQNLVAAGFFQGKGRGTVFAHPDFMIRKNGVLRRRKSFLRRFINGWQIKP